MTYTHPLTLSQAIRHAGATPGPAGTLTHCHQTMVDNILPDGEPGHYRCTTCGTTIQHIDYNSGPGQAISPHHREALEVSRELWTISTNPENVLQERAP